MYFGIFTCRDSENLNGAVQYRMAETILVHGLDKVVRVHRARGDSGRNKAERTNANSPCQEVDITASSRDSVNCISRGENFTLNM